MISKASGVEQVVLQRALPKAAFKGGCGVYNWASVWYPAGTRTEQEMPDPVSLRSGQESFTCTGSPTLMNHDLKIDRGFGISSLHTQLHIKLRAPNFVGSFF